jgi:3-dehydroquinate synthase
MVEIVPTIYSSDDPVHAIRELLKNIDYSRLAVLVDDNTEKYCLPEINSAFNDPLIISIPSGEVNKNINTCTIVWEALTKANFDRKALLINIGGGVVGDLGGFCAATYKRGIRFINIPTTLLSQVDASVGGKLGVDFLNYKNQIGVFVEPEYILINTGFLETLPENELKSGYAEVVKHALIRDKDLWQHLQAMDLAAIKSMEIIARAITIKWNIVQQDFQEENERKLLNFGHTIGHAIESYLLQDDQRRVLHGEAVAAGMIAESYLSHQIGLLSAENLREIEKYLLAVFPYIELKPSEVEEITGYLQQDKKNIGGKLRFSLLESIGKGVYDQELSSKQCADALAYYINL